MLLILLWIVYVFFFQAEDGIRDLVRSRGLGDVYKRQTPRSGPWISIRPTPSCWSRIQTVPTTPPGVQSAACLLYTSDAADERSSVDLGGRRIIKKKIYDRYADDIAVD